MMSKPDVKLLILILTYYSFHKSTSSDMRCNTDTDLDEVTWSGTSILSSLELHRVTSCPEFPRLAQENYIQSGNQELPFSAQNRYNHPNDMVIKTLPDIIKLFCCFLMWQFLTSSSVTELIYIYIFYSIAVEARVHGDLARVIVFS